MTQFCALFLGIYALLAPQRGGPWHNAPPPKYSPDSRTEIQVLLSAVESRTQGSRPRPRTQKKSEAKAKISLFEDRPSRGQGQKCLRPRPRIKNTAASVLQNN